MQFLLPAAVFGEKSEFSSKSMSSRVVFSNRDITSCKTLQQLSTLESPEGQFLTIMTRHLRSRAKGSGSSARPLELSIKESVIIGQLLRASDSK